MAILTAALDQVKEGFSSMIDAGLVERLCREAGHKWRERELDPATTVGLFAQQVMHGNVSCQELVRRTGAEFSGSAYCQARRRNETGKERNGDVNSFPSAFRRLLLGSPLAADGVLQPQPFDGAGTGI